MSLREYKRTAPFGTGESLEAQQRREAAHEAAVIRTVREYIWKARRACQVCGGTRPTALPDEMHEDPPRSKTRGLPPETRFNLVVCGRLCAPCHADVTEKRIRLVFADASLGFMGAVHAEPWIPKRARGGDGDTVSPPSSHREEAPSPPPPPTKPRGSR